MKKQVKTLTMVGLVVLGLFGLIFVAALTEEIFHFFDLEGEAVCLASNMYMEDDVQEGHLLMFTVINSGQYSNAETYDDARRKSEKIALILNQVIMLGGASLMGYLVGGVIHGKRTQKSTN